MCDATPAATITLPPRPESARTARLFLADRHCPKHGAQVLDVAVLLVSELVSNAVRHGSPPVTLETECDSSHALAVRVTDASPALPESAGEVGEDAEGGRGLAILQILSDAWGIDPHRDGKTVWFQILPPGEHVDLRNGALTARQDSPSGGRAYPDT